MTNEMIILELQNELDTTQATIAKLERQLQKAKEMFADIYSVFMSESNPDKFIHEAQSIFETKINEIAGIKQKEKTMAFKNKNMSVIAYANGFTMWHYRHGDTEVPYESFADITANGYFDSVKTLWNVGDMVVINASDRSGIAFCTETNPTVKLTVKTN